MIDLSQIVLAVVFSAISWALAVLANRKFARFEEVPSVFAFDHKTVLSTSSRARAIFGHAMGNTVVFAMLLVLQSVGAQLLNDAMGLAGLIALTLQMGMYVAINDWAKNQPHTP